MIELVVGKIERVFSFVCFEDVCLIFLFICFVILFFFVFFKKKIAFFLQRRNSIPATKVVL